MRLLTPKQLAEELQMSVPAISMCVKAGAPVYRWGPTGYRYRINPDEFIEWMDRHGREEQAKRAAPTLQLTVEQMADRRHALLKSLGG